MLVIVALGECVAIKMICCQMDFQTHLLLLLCWVVLKLPFIIIIITIIKMVINFFSASPGTSYAGNILLLCGQMRLLCIFQENCTIAWVVEFLCRLLSGDCQPLLDDTINGQQWESKMRNGKVKTKDDFSNLNFLIIPVLSVSGFGCGSSSASVVAVVDMMNRDNFLRKHPLEARAATEGNGQEGKGVRFLPSMDLNNDYCETKSSLGVKNNRCCPLLRISCER